MYPSTEKALVSSLKSALADLDNGVSAADEKIFLLARAIVEIAEEDDADRSRLMAAAMVREANVPLAWLQAFADTYEVDGMATVDRRAAGVEFWHSAGELWQYERKRHPAEIGRLDGAEQAERTSKFIAERNRSRQM